VRRVKHPRPTGRLRRRHRGERSWLAPTATATSCARTKKLIAFGQLTIAHRLVRLHVLEQLYRGFRILRGERYHRE
jgi:hypothetical protein